MEHANRRVHARNICSQLTGLVATDPSVEWSAIEPGFTRLFDISSATKAEVEKQNALLALVKEVRSSIAPNS